MIYHDKYNNNQQYTKINQIIIIIKLNKLNYYSYNIYHIPYIKLNRLNYYYYNISHNTPHLPTATCTGYSSKSSSKSGGVLIMPYLELELKLELVLHLVNGFVVWIRVTVRRALNQFTHLRCCLFVFVFCFWANTSVFRNRSR